MVRKKFKSNSLYLEKESCSSFLFIFMLELIKATKNCTRLSSPTSSVRQKISWEIFFILKFFFFEEGGKRVLKYIKLRSTRQKKEEKWMKEKYLKSNQLSSRGKIYSCLYEIHLANNIKLSTLNYSRFKFFVDKISVEFDVWE